MKHLRQFTVPPFARAVAAALACCAPLVSQSPLSTMFAGNNQGNVGGAVLFNLTVNNGLTIDRIDVNVASGPGFAGTLDVLIVPVAYTGHENDPGAWQPISTGNALVTAPVDVPTTCTLSSPVSLSPGSYGVMLRADTWAHRYTNGALPAPGNTFSTAEMTAGCGAAQNVPFSGLFTPRIANVSLHYSLGGTLASSTAFGAGCGSSTSPLALTTLGLPWVGTTTTLVTTGTGNASAAFGILGLRQFDPGVSLAPFGMPGCLQSVRTDVVQPLPVIFGSAITSLTIPNAPHLCGLPIYAQSVSNDQGHNPMGLTTSNGRRLVVGGIGGHRTLRFEDLVFFDPAGHYTQLVQPSAGAFCELDLFDMGPFNSAHTVTWTTTNPNVTVSPATSTLNMGNLTQHAVRLQNGSATAQGGNLIGTVTGPHFTTQIVVAFNVFVPTVQVCVLKKTSGGVSEPVAGNTITVREVNNVTLTVDVEATGNPGELRVKRTVGWGGDTRVKSTVYSCIGICIPGTCTGTVTIANGPPKTGTLTCACQ
ncbi:MAG: hypothetical protein KDC98_21705 [Planctomycetes bacterium]|nr:hypothetical protein [Planctomycetota bacterium]